MSNPVLLGFRDTLPGGSGLRHIQAPERLAFTHLDRTPRRFPDLPSGHLLICGLTVDVREESKWRRRERLWRCLDLAGMQRLFERYASREAFRLDWYLAVYRNERLANAPLTVE